MGLPPVIMVHMNYSELHLELLEISSFQDLKQEQKKPQILNIQTKHVLSPLTQFFGFLTP